MMANTGRLRPNGAPFSAFMYSPVARSCHLGFPVEVIKKQNKMACLVCHKARKFMNLGYRQDILDMT